MIIDAENLIIGRVAAFVAKKALLGEKIDIVNCEKAVITGNKTNILKGYNNKVNHMGTYKKGPFYIRSPDRMLRRVVRGMLPYKQYKGADAYKRVMCYNGVPEEFKDKKIETLSSANIEKIPNLKFISLRDVCKSVGGRV